MQICPQFIPFAQAIREAACFTLAVSSTTTGLFPPNSNVTDARCLAAACMTILPNCGAPVKNIWLNGCANRSVEVWMPPSTTATSCSGKVASTISRITFALFGDISDGFNIAVFPAATAETNGPNVKFRGKFHG